MLRPFEALRSPQALEEVDWYIANFFIFDTIKNMKSIVFYGPKDFRVEDRPRPMIEDGEMLLEVIACGLCGTDLKIFENGHHAVKPPLITGHEIVGCVIESRAATSDVKTGDNVIVVTPVGCMNCKYCTRGEQNMCSLVADKVHSIGYYTDGGFAEYMRVPREAVDQNVLIKIPETDAPLNYFAICEPLSCVINGQDKLKISSDDIVLVIGSGPIGVMHVYLAKARGVKKIILADLEKKKLDLAKKAPADVFVDSSKENLEEIISRETGGRGADVVIVACASGKAQESAVKLAGIRARISFFGGLPKTSPDISLPSNIVHYREQEIYGAFASNRRQYEEALNLILSGAINPSKIITHTFHLEEIEKAVALMKNGEALKMLVVPGRKTA